MKVQRSRGPPPQFVMSADINLGLGSNRTIYRVIRAYGKTKVDFCVSICAFNPKKHRNYLKKTVQITKKSSFMHEFAELGEDLADIVCDFAFKCRYRAFFYSLRQYLIIRCFRVPDHCLKRRLYSPVYRTLCLNPLKVFEPIENFGSYRELFDWDTIYMLLWQLDFRRRIVKVYGSRGSWHIRFALNWTSVLDFVIYYRTLVGMPSCVRVFKPTLLPFMDSNGPFSPFNSAGYLPFLRPV